MTRLTIVIPYFESHDRLGACLASVRRHTEGDVEVLLYDDASPSQQHLKAALDADIRVRYGKENQGPSHWRNQGIMDAGGDYICFLDSDDILVTDPRVLLDGRGPADIALGRFVGEGDFPLVDYNLPRTVSYSADPVLVKKMTFQANLYRRDFLQRHAIRFPEDMRLGEDTVFLARAQAAADTIWLTNREVMRYISAPGSLSQVALETDSLEALFRLLPQRVMEALAPFPAARGTAFHMQASRRLVNLGVIAKRSDTTLFTQFSAVFRDIVAAYWPSIKDPDLLRQTNIKWSDAKTSLLDQLVEGAIKPDMLIRDYLVHADSNL